VPELAMIGHRDPLEMDWPMMFTLWALVCTAPSLGFILWHLLDVCVIVYLDDILIYSEDEASHEEHVQEVLCRLHKHSLYTNPQKCKFHTNTMEYLGYILSLNGLSMSLEKVKDWAEPCKVKDVQSFLSFTNFYQHFIHEYSDITLGFFQ
jgi:hypothetical protein